MKIMLANRVDKFELTSRNLLVNIRCIMCVSFFKQKLTMLAVRLTVQ